MGNKTPLKKDFAINEKIALTVQEAAILSNVGENKLYSLVRQPRCPFVLHVGRKRLIKRKEFEKYLSERIEI